MKYTIEEIESMRDLKLKLHEDYGDDFTVEWEIITDLVEELKQLNGNIAHIIEHLDDADEALKSARKDLDEI